MSVYDQIDPETADLLARFGFDEARFEALSARVATRDLSPETTVLAGTIEPPLPGDLTVLPAPGAEAYDAARETGLEALRAGKVAQVVLCGGMATRFGGVVKGVVEVFEGRSFLDVKLGETARLGRAANADVPVALMTSFATDATVRGHVAALDVPSPEIFSQFISLRLEPDGTLFHGEDGLASPYSPGHGDLFEALERSGALERFRELGVEQLAVSNVDNLGARLDPVVIGAHLIAGKPLTVEVTTKDGDAGGAPARVDGRLRLVEGVCFPPDFDQDSIPVFNTNTSVFSVEAAPHGRDLTWLYVEKLVDGRLAVQLERLYHELSDKVATTYLVVPRRGTSGRFMPVKVPADVERVEPDLAELLAAPPF